MLSDIITAIENDTIYDFIACNYYKLSNNDLKVLLLEYIYATYKLSKNDKYDNNDIINELKDRLDCYE